jgi:hypothetical protein
MPKIRVTAEYGLKTAIVPGDSFQGMQTANASLTVEEDLAANADDKQVVARLNDLFRMLDNGAKLSVASSLDVGYQMDGNIVRVQPIVVANIPHTAPQPSQATAPVSTYQPPAYSQPPAQGGGGQHQAPKVDRKTLPQVWLDYFNSGAPIAFYDCRGPKQQGIYSARAADFQSVAKFQVNGKEDSIPLWLTTKDGQPVPATIELLQRAAAAEKARADSAPF